MSAHYGNRCSKKQNTNKENEESGGCGGGGLDIAGKTTHRNIQPGRLAAIFMLCLSSTSTNEEMTSHNWIVRNTVHHKWHIIYSNEYILLRANMIDRPVVEWTLWGTEHNMLIFSTWMDAASSETSVVMSVENKTTLFETILCWFTYTPFFLVRLHCSIVLKTVQVGKPLLLYSDLLTKPELGHLFSSFQLGHILTVYFKLDKADIHINCESIPKLFHASSDDNYDRLQVRFRTTFVLVVIFSSS